MVQTESILEKHLETCDDVFRIIAEENRLLKVEQQIPGPRLLERKRVLLAELDEGLSILRLWDPDKQNPPDSHTVERLRSRILQILHLDRENEQLLLRYSMSGHRPRATKVPAPSLQQIKGLYRT